jgi:hypothetical protein
MPNEAPFDVWDGEELGLTGEPGPDAAEEVAMHVDPDSEPPAEGGPHWSDLTDAGEDDPEAVAPVCYFADEQPEAPAAAGEPSATGDEPEPDLEEILERQHYAFPI